MKTLIISGGEFDKGFVASFLLKNSYDYIIAVDNGVKYAKELGIQPDLLVGDFDTYEGELPQDIKIKRSIPQKDDTDTEMAIREALNIHSDMDIVCAMGGRMDHLLGNIHNLYIALQAGYRARLLDAQNIIELRDKTFTMTREEYPHKYISFVPFAGQVTGLKLTDFQYPLYDYTLEPGASRCISNEFLDGKYSAQVSMKSGVLIVINSGD